jgi:uncharacterized protein (TIGR01777 family)
LKHAVVTGATGFLGRALLARLEQPVALSRNPDRARSAIAGAVSVGWQPEASPPPASAFKGVRAVFHLAGEPINRRWTARGKREIRQSRVLGTRNLVSALGELEQPPEVLVSASAVGYYGSRGAEPISEDTGPGSDFLASVCQEWEEEALKARSLGIRVVSPRIGIVLGKGGGALGRLVPLFRLGMGGRLGNGSHYWSWIHIDDLVGIMLHVARTAGLEGPVNAVAPIPVTNATFTRTLARVVRRPALFPVPAPALKLVLGQLASMLLSSQRVVPEAAMEAGYTFRYTELEDALRSILPGSGGSLK